MIDWQYIDLTGNVCHVCGISNNLPHKPNCASVSNPANADLILDRLERDMLSGLGFYIDEEC